LAIGLSEWSEDVNIVDLLKHHNWIPRKPATEDDVRQLKEKFKIELPNDYESLLQTSNGYSLSGFETPLIVWSTMEVLALFREHDLYENIPQSLIFGGDGGGTVYCYDLRTKNDKGNYDVFFVKEEEAYYDKIFFRTSSLTELVEKIVKNEKLNVENR